MKDESGLCKSIIIDHFDDEQAFEFDQSNMSIQILKKEMQNKPGNHNKTELKASFQKFIKNEKAARHKNNGRKMSLRVI